MATIITPRTFPQMATARPGVFKPLPPAANPDGDVLRVELSALDSPPRSHFVATVAEIKERIPLNAAEVIVFQDAAQGAGQTGPNALRRGSSRTCSRR